MERVELTALNGDGRRLRCWAASFGGERQSWRGEDNGLAMADVNVGSE
jgi:hypothetical protein